jgi:hypothetical protein
MSNYKTYDEYLDDQEHFSISDETIEMIERRNIKINSDENN